MKVPVELKKNYLQRRIKDIQQSQHTLNSGDYNLALKLGHQVKGNAETFEFPQIAPLGTAIEQAARLQNKEELLLLLKRMERFLQQAQQTLT